MWWGDANVNFNALTKYRVSFSWFDRRIRYNSASTASIIFLVGGQNIIEKHALTRGVFNIGLHLCHTLSAAESRRQLGFFDPSSLLGTMVMSWGINILGSCKRKDESTQGGSAQSFRRAVGMVSTVKAVSNHGSIWTSDQKARTKLGRWSSTDKKNRSSIHQRCYFNWDGDVVDFENQHTNS